MDVVAHFVLHTRPSDSASAFLSRDLQTSTVTATSEEAWSATTPFTSRGKDIACGSKDVRLKDTYSAAAHAVHGTHRDSIQLVQRLQLWLALWLVDEISRALDGACCCRGTLRLRQYACVHVEYDVYDGYVRPTLQRKCDGIERHFALYIGWYVSFVCCADVPRLRASMGMYAACLLEYIGC